MSRNRKRAQILVGFTALMIIPPILSLCFGVNPLWPIAGWWSCHISYGLFFDVTEAR
jgi:hypothetical protein